MTGAGSIVEKVIPDSNGGGGFLVAGSVFQSTATRNGSFGIFAITVRDCTATDNHNNGVQLDGFGGVSIGNIASFNGGQGITVAQWHSDQ